jgi:hypothetical protein
MSPPFDFIGFEKQLKSRFNFGLSDGDKLVIRYPGQFGDELSCPAEPTVLRRLRHWLIQNNAVDQFSEQLFYSVVLWLRSNTANADKAGNIPGGYISAPTSSPYARARDAAGAHSPPVASNQPPVLPIPIPRKG